MASYKDKIITFPLFNTYYPKKPSKNLARIKKPLTKNLVCG